MKIAVLGTGSMGSTYISNISAMPNAELVGVFDVTEERAAQGAALGNTVGFTNFDEMIEKANPDLVCVCLPTFLHKEYVLKVAKAGKHVVCEKPMALSIEDTEVMEQACLEAGVRLFVGHVLRFFPNYADLKSKVDSGLIGKVKVAHAKRYSAFPQGVEDWFKDRSKSGGVIMDLLIHDLDFLRWTMGEIDSVFTQFKEVEGKQIANVTLKFEDGAIAKASGFWGYPGEFTTSAELACEKGVVRLNNLANQTLVVKQDIVVNSNQPGVAIPSSPTLRDPYYTELAHFIQCIETNAQPIISVHDAKQAVAIGLAANESAATGKPVKVQRIAANGGTK